MAAPANDDKTKVPTPQAAPAQDPLSQRVEVLEQLLGAMEVAHQDIRGFQKAQALAQSDLLARQHELTQALAELRVKVDSPLVVSDGIPLYLAPEVHDALAAIADQLRTDRHFRQFVRQAVGKMQQQYKRGPLTDLVDVVVGAGVHEQDI